MIKRFFWPLAFMVISIFLWMMAYDSINPDEYSWLLIGQRYSSEGITQETLNRHENKMLFEDKEDYPGPYLAWEQETNQTNSNDDIEKSNSDVSVLRISGDASLLWDGSKFSSGNAPGLDSENSCAISKALAFELWGTDQIIGSKLTWNKKEYEVCGILNEDKNMLTIIQNPKTNVEQKFSSLEIMPLKNSEFAKGISYNDRLQEFLSFTAFPKGDLIITYYENAKIMRILTILPSIVLMIIMLFRANSSIDEREKNIIKRYFPLIIALLACAILILLLRKVLFWPEEYLPSVWSNFDFWASKFSETMNYFLKTMSMPKYLPDIDMMSRQIKAAFSLILSLFLIFPAANIKSLKPADRMIYLFAALFSAFIAAILLKTNSVYFIWLSWPVFIASSIVNSMVTTKTREDMIFGNN